MTAEFGGKTVAALDNKVGVSVQTADTQAVCGSSSSLLSIAGSRGQCRPYKEAFIF